MRVWLMSAIAALLPLTAQGASVTLYDQDFETPSGYINNFGSGYGDLSQQQVNTLYGGQPAGFTFTQQFTVETLLLSGSQAFGTGYDDPGGQGGDYALGMQNRNQDDLLGLSFSVGSFDFFNFQIDISSIGLHGGPGAPIAAASDIPKFVFTLFDNPLGGTGLGSGTVLDQATMTGTASDLDTLEWTTGTFALDASQATNGNVTLRVDLVQGGYAAFDNFLITASDTAGGGLPSVPLPAGVVLLATGLAGLRVLGKKQSASVRSLAS